MAIRLVGIRLIVIRPIVIRRVPAHRQCTLQGHMRMAMSMCMCMYMCMSIQVDPGYRHSSAAPSAGPPPPVPDVRPRVVCQVVGIITRKDILPEHIEAHLSEEARSKNPPMATDAKSPLKAKDVTTRHPTTHLVHTPVLGSSEMLGPRRV